MSQFYPLSIFSKRAVLLSILTTVFICAACSISIVDVQRDYIPNPYDFVPVDDIPDIDTQSLEASIIYPSEALRLRVEGKVYLRVLIGANGLPQRYLIEQADSPLLIAEAIRVIMNAKFIPLSQNGKAIDCWITIPLTFKL